VGASAASTAATLSSGIDGGSAGAEARPSHADATKRKASATTTTTAAAARAPKRRRKRGDSDDDDEDDDDEEDAGGDGAYGYGGDSRGATAVSQRTPSARQRSGAMAQRASYAEFGNGDDDEDEDEDAANGGAEAADDEL
jgi:hypothetical protein